MKILLLGILIFTHLGLCLGTSDLRKAHLTEFRSLVKNIISSSDQRVNVLQKKLLLLVKIVINTFLDAKSRWVDDGIERISKNPDGEARSLRRSLGQWSDVNISALEMLSNNISVFAQQINKLLPALYGNSLKLTVTDPSNKSMDWCMKEFNSTDQTVNTNNLLQWIVLLVKQLPHTDHQLRDQLLKASHQYERVISDLFWDKTRKFDDENANARALVEWFVSLLKHIPNTDSELFRYLYQAGRLFEQNVNDVFLDESGEEKQSNIKAVLRWSLLVLNQTTRASIHHFECLLPTFCDLLRATEFALSGRASSGSCIDEKELPEIRRKLQELFKNLPSATTVQVESVFQAAVDFITEIQSFSTSGELDLLEFAFVTGVNQRRMCRILIKQATASPGSGAQCTQS